MVVEQRGPPVGGGVVVNERPPVGEDAVDVEVALEGGGGGGALLAVGALKVAALE